MIEIYLKFPKKFEVKIGQDRFSSGTSTLFFSNFGAAGAPASVPMSMSRVSTFLSLCSQTASVSLSQGHQ